MLIVLALHFSGCKAPAPVVSTHDKPETALNDTLVPIVPTAIDTTLVAAADTSTLIPPISELPDSLAGIAPQATALHDSLVSDTTSHAMPDSLAGKMPKKKEQAFDTKIFRSAVDSVIMDLKTKKIYYYGKAVVKYDDIVLEADFLEFNLNTSVCTARGLTDSTGKLYGTPVFTQGETKFEAEEMAYNFKTKKGIITKVFTEESGGYLHGTKIKRMDDNSINIQSGGFTTCDLREHPHYQFRFTKAKVIPNDKIVTGPIFLTIEDVPLPIGLPFALIPNVKGQKSGIIVPTYGESANRGFYLENGGYYWAINPNCDFQLLGDIYTRGSWALKPTFRYAQRYKHSGAISLGYAVNKIGSKDAADFSQSNDFKVSWTHKQDSKAHPRHTFSADVNIISSNYNKYNAASSNEYLSNTFKSSIAYQTNFAGKYYLTLNGSHSQNTLTKQVTFTLPEVTFTANRTYPLQNVGKAGKKHWYKDFNISYTMNARNYMSNVDSLLFRGEWYKNMRNGVKNSIPVNLPIKLLKHFTWTNSATFNDYIYFDHIEKQWSDDMLVNGNDTTYGYLRTDTVRGFRNIIDFNLSSNITTKLYGMVRFKKGPIRAVRHVFTPTIGLSYTPDFSDPRWNVYGHYTDTAGTDQIYNMYANALYGSPSMTRSGRLTYSFGNTLDMKVPSKSDTITGLKKVTLIESLNFSGNYDLTQDTLNLSYLSVSGRTTLFKKLKVTYSSIWDPYVIDSLGNRVNRLEIIDNKRLFHKNSSAWKFSLSWSISQKDFEKLKKGKSNATDTFGDDIAKRAEKSNFVTEGELDEIMGNPNAYVDWTTPWSLTIGYNFGLTTSMAYANLVGIATNRIVHTVSLNGDVSITPKWKISCSTGWDFTGKGITYTSVNIYRDLHCWEMRFNWIPTGTYKSWNFTINVKAEALKDLKLTKKKDHRDN